MTPYTQACAVLRTRQRGSVLVNVAAGMSAMIILLSVIDLGFLYYYKREYQKAADLGALAGAQLLRTGCANAQASATDNAGQNLVGRIATVPAPQCGVWSPTTVPFFTPGSSNVNAIRVTVLGSAPRFLPYIEDRQLSAVATATVGDPKAAFSVGTKLASVSGNGLLGGTLKGLGLDLTGTSLVGYDGLADVKITPGGLLEELGIPVSADVTVGDLNALLAAEQVSVGDVLDAVVTLSGRNDLLTINATLLNAIQANLGLSTLNDIALGSESGAGGLFAEIVFADGSAASALQVGVSALDLISVSVGVATANHAIDIPGLSLLGNTITAKVGIVEPPSIAIGTLGPNGICDGDEDCPTAYTAQVRAFVHIDTGNLPLLGGLLSSTGLLRLNLPIVLDVVSGKGALTKMCTTDLAQGGEDRAEIDVESEILKVCVGAVNESTLFSTSASCDVGLGNQQLVNVLGLISVNNKIQIDGLPADGIVTLGEGQTETVDNDLAIGTLVGDVVSELTNLLLGGAASGSPSGSQNQAVAQQLFSDAATQVAASNPSCPVSANSYPCNSQRLTVARSRIETAASQSGLLTGLLNGIGDLLGAVGGLLVGDSCSYKGLLGPVTPPANGCRDLIKTTLDKNSSASGGGNVSNTLSVLVGLLKPILNALGSSVLTPLLEDVLGLSLGNTDVHLISLDCGGNPKLVE